MIYFTATIGPEFAKVLLSQNIEGQFAGWIADEACNLTKAQQALAHQALENFHAGLHKQWITFKSPDDKVAGVFRSMVSYLQDWTEPGDRGNVNRLSLYQDAYGNGPVDSNIMVKLRQDADYLHHALVDLAATIKQVSPEPEIES